MELRLSQKERALLEDQKAYEDICVKKYSSYAQQAKDKELVNMFNSISAQEQTHYDSIDQMLQGKIPEVAKQMQQQGQQQQNMQKQQYVQQQQGQQQSNVFSSMSNKEDKDLLTDLLETEKHISSIYNTAVFESASPVVRQTIQHIQKEEQQHGEQIFNYMHSHGMYQVK